MKITVTIEPGNKKEKIEITKGTAINEIVKKIGLKPDTLIVLRDNIPIPVDEILNESQELRIIQVASGG